MRKITSRTYAWIVAVLMCSLCASPSFATDYPTLSELFGRYTFSGTFVSANETSGKAVQEPVARTGYTMIVVPGTEANTVLVQGFFGYGGGLTATYNEAEGKLHCAQNAFFACANIDMRSLDGLMVYADAGVGKFFDLNFQVSRQDGQIVITALEDVKFTAMGDERDTWTYASGYTLTRETVNVPVGNIAGTCDFKGNEAIQTSYGEPFEEFELTLTPKADGKVTVKGLFDFTEEEIEADYFADGGILLFPRDYIFSNGAFMGSREGTPENDFADVVVRQEAAPYMLVEDGKLVTMSSFIVNGKYDGVQSMTPAFSFLGGEGVLKSDGVDDVPAVGTPVVVSTKGGIRVQVAGVTSIAVYDMRAVKVAEATAASAEFGGLPAGVYVVKVGGQAVKVVVEVE